MRLFGRYEDRVRAAEYRGGMSEVLTFDDLALEIGRAPPALGKVRLVTVDGPSGSGKTTFARRLVAALTAHGSGALVEIEALYEGWTLDGAWQRLHDSVLEPMAAGRPGGFHPYDWVSFGWSRDWATVAPSAVLVVEGCGSAPGAADHQTTLQIWIEAPPDVALARGMAREGIDLDRHLREWKRLEASHFVEQRTRQRADLRVDGAPATPLPYDPDLAFTLL